MLSVEDELIEFLNFHKLSFKPQFLTSSTYSYLLYHIVWSVKNREDLIPKSIQGDLHKKIQDELETIRCTLHAIGNVEDHIHLLVQATTTISTADLVQKLKTTTAKFINTQTPNHHAFSWQKGYAVFSVGKPALKAVLAYVNNQEAHHECRRSAT